jgi:hypothetical protein
MSGRVSAKAARADLVGDEGGLEDAPARRENRTAAIALVPQTMAQALRP